MTEELAIMIAVLLGASPFAGFILVTIYKDQKKVRAEQKARCHDLARIEREIDASNKRRGLK